MEITRTVTIAELIRNARDSRTTLFQHIFDDIPLFSEYNTTTDLLLLNQFGSRKICVYEDIMQTPLIIDYFRSMALSIVNQNRDNYNKIESLMEIEYNPLENYDRIEEFYGSEINTTIPKGKDISTSYEFPYDSEEFVNKIKNETSFSDDRENETKMTYGVGDEKRYNHLHGNIGTTQTNEMFENELALRRKMVAYNCICDIIKQISY